MPPNPIDACLNHVISQSLENIDDAVKKGDLSAIAIECAHSSYVSKILNDYLLYDAFDGWDNTKLAKYWDDVRVDYIKNGKADYVTSMGGAWQLLEFALNQYWHEKGLRLDTDI